MVSSASRTDLAQDFALFVAADGGKLLHFATLLSGSRAAAEDLVQSALTSTFVHWRRVRDGQPQAYVRRAIVNANVTRWRSGTRTVPVAEVPDRPGQDTYAGIDDRDALMRCLARLSSAQRTVILLRDLEQLDYREIAEVLRLPESTVRSHRARGLAALRQQLGKESEKDHEDGAAPVAAAARTSQRTAKDVP